MQNLHSVLAMSKGRKRTIFLAAVLLAGGLIWAALANREPRYDGHSLSYWLDAYVSAATAVFPDKKPEIDMETAEKAIRCIGSNAVPNLLTWISYDPSTFKTNFLHAVQGLRQTRFGRYLPVSLTEDRAHYRAGMAWRGFLVLGPEARPAIPALTRMANDPARRLSAQYATSALCCIGPDALPPLLSILTNPAAVDRGIASLGIEAFATNTENTLFILSVCLSNNDPLVIACATNSLYRFGLSLGEDLPAFTKALTDTNLYVRQAATNTLMIITPQPSTTPPPQR